MGGLIKKKLHETWSFNHLASIQVLFSVRMLQVQVQEFKGQDENNCC